MANFTYNKWATGDIITASGLNVDKARPKLVLTSTDESNGWQLDLTSFGALTPDELLELHVEVDGVLCGITRIVTGVDGSSNTYYSIGYGSSTIYYYPNTMTLTSTLST